MVPDFTGHGLCAGENNRWAHTIGASAEIQGLDFGVPKGAFHPNFAGYRAYTGAIYPNLN